MPEQKKYTTKESLLPLANNLFKTYEKVDVLWGVENGQFFFKEGAAIAYCRDQKFGAPVEITRNFLSHYIFVKGESDKIKKDMAGFHEESVADEPVAEEPVADEPVADEPVAEEPVAEEKPKTTRKTRSKKSK